MGRSRCHEAALLVLVAAAACADASDASREVAPARATAAVEADVRRTVVLLYAPTRPGEDLFFRGGLDHGEAARRGVTCTKENGACAVPVRHRSTRNATTAPWKRGDTLLDWYGAEPGQPDVAGTPADWTTDAWPYAPPARTVAADGYGVAPLNRVGPHHWMLDVDMDCGRAFRDARGVAWFEVKAFVTGGAGWEPDVRQPGAPYASGNHFAQCGRLTVLRRGEASAVFQDIPDDGPTDAGASPSDGGDGATPHLCAAPPSPPPSRGRSLHVAVDGVDGASADGSELRPYASLAYASARARPGDTVLVRGGTYFVAREQSLGARGTEAAPITFRPRAGERVVLDASRATLDGAFGGDRYRGVVTLGGAHLVFEGFEITSSVASGLKLYQASHVTVRGNTIHDIAEQALGGSGDDVVLEGNHVYRAVTSNTGGAVDRARGGFGWSPAVLSWRFDEPRRRSRRWRVVGNDVHDVWGECLDALYVDGAELSGNRVRGCYSASIYLDNARDVRVERNHVVADDAHRRARGGERAHGVVFAVESADVGCEGSGACPLEDLVVASNLVQGAGVGLLFFRSSGSAYAYRRLKIAHNVVVAPVNESLYVAKVASGAEPSALATGNVFEAGRNGAVNVEDAEAWTFRRNLYPQGALPARGDHRGSLVGDPGFVAPGPTAPPEGFRLRPGARAARAGAPDPAVTIDFACAPRDPEAPSIGLFEP